MAKLHNKEKDAAFKNILAQLAPNIELLVGKMVMHGYTAVDDMEITFDLCAQDERDCNLDTFSAVEGDIISIVMRMSCKPLRPQIQIVRGGSR